MADVADLAVVVTAETHDAEEGLSRVKDHVSSLGTLFERAAVSGAGFAVGMGAINLAVNAVQGSFSAFSGAAIGMNNTLQQSTIAFTTMLGSAQAAGSFIQELQHFAAVTPFHFQGLVESSQQMLAMGFAAKDVVPLLTAVGNAASALGSGDEGINRITLALGQMNARTTVSAQDMLQLTQAGVPAWQILADATGKTTAEVQKMSEQGQIASSVFIKAFKDFSDAHWGDMMEKQSHTFQGALSTISDSLQQTVATAFRPFFDVMTTGADRLAQFLSSDKFQTWALVASNAVQRVLDALKPIGDVVSMAFDQITKGDFSGAFDTVVNAIKGAIQGGLAAIESFGQAMFGAGVNLMETLAGGIVQGASDAINAAINYVSSLIASFFIGQSPPPMGPLSQIQEGGKRLIETYGQGMQQGLEPVKAAVNAVNAEFLRSDLSGALTEMAAKFDASKGHLADMKALGKDVAEAVKEIDQETRDLDFEMNAVRHTEDAIKAGFEDQLRPLQQQLDLLRGAHDFTRDEQSLAFEQRDIEVRRQELAARGNKDAEAKAKAARDQLSLEKETYDLNTRQADLARKRQEIPLERQIQDIKTAEQQAVTPLEAQLRVLQNQKTELDYQKKQWDDLKQSIASAVQEATPKGGGGGGAGGLKVPAGAGQPLNLGGAITKAVDDAAGQAEAKAKEAGEKIASGITTGVQTFLADKGPSLIGGGLGALLGAAVLGPVGFVAGGLVGSRLADGIQAELKRHGIDFGYVKDALQTALGDLKSFGLDAFADDIKRAFGQDITPFTEQVKAAIVEFGKAKDAAKALADAIGDVADAARRGEAVGAFTAQLRDLGAPQTAGAVARALQDAQTAMRGVSEAAQTVGGWLDKLARLFSDNGDSAQGWGRILDTVLAGVVTGLTAPIRGLATLTTTIEAVSPALDAFSAAYAAWATNTGKVAGEWAVATGKAYADWALTTGDAIGKWATATEATLTGWGNTTGQAIAAWVTTAETNLTAWGDTTGKAIADWVASTEKSIADWGNTAGKSVTDFAAGVVSTLDGLVKDAGKLAADIGNAVVDGIKNGIVGRAEEVARQAAKLVTDAVDAAKRAAGAHSPSTVFAELGSDLVAGLVQGINDNAAKAVAAAAALVAQTTAAAQRAAQGAYDPLRFGLTPGHMLPGQTTQELWETMLPGKVWADEAQHNQGDYQAAGRDVAEGFAQGIRDAASAVADAVSSLGEAAIGGLADATGSHSPSTLAAQIGADVVAGFRDGITKNLDALPEAFSGVTAAFARVADEVKRSASDLVGNLTTGWTRELARFNSPDRARQLGNVIRDYFGEAVQQFAQMAQAVEPQIVKVRDDLAKALADAVQAAAKSAQDAIDNAKKQIADAVSSLADQRATRARQQAFDAQLSGEQDTHQQARDDAEAQYRYETEMRRQEEDTVRALQKATSDEERARIKAEAQDRLEQLNLQKQREDEDRAHQRQVAADEAVFAQHLADERQQFEDQLADEALAKQIKRIQTETQARLLSVQTEMAAREQAAVGAAQDALRKITSALSDQVNAAIGKVFDSLGDEMAKRGGPTDPGFLGGIRSQLGPIFAGAFGNLQQLLRDLGGDANDPNAALLPGGPPAAPGVPNVSWNGSGWSVAPSGPAPAGAGSGRLVWNGNYWVDTAPVDPYLFPNGAPQPTPTTIQVVLPQGAFYGSLQDLARELSPELQRLLGV